MKKEMETQQKKIKRSNRISICFQHTRQRGDDWATAVAANTTACHWLRRQLECERVLGSESASACKYVRARYEERRLALESFTHDHLEQ